MCTDEGPAGPVPATLHEFEPDVEISDDQNWAFWETQRFPIAPTVPDVLNPISNAPHGVHIVDIKDKAHPKDVGFYPVPPDGPHSITYANVSGRNILLLSVYAFAYAYEDVEVPTAQRLEITELDTSGPVPTLKKLAEYVEPGSTGKGPGNFPHDVSVQQHPITKNNSNATSPIAAKANALTVRPMAARHVLREPKSKYGDISRIFARKWKRAVACPCIATSKRVMVPVPTSRRRPAPRSPRASGSRGSAGTR